MVKKYKKGGRMRDTSNEQEQHQQEQDELAHINVGDDNIDINIMQDGMENNENLDDSFMSSDTEEIIPPTQPIRHYIDLAYISNPNNMMTEPLLVFNEYYTKILTDEHVMLSLAEDDSLRYILDDLLRLMSYAHDESGLSLMAYYLTDETLIMNRYPQVTINFLTENRNTFIRVANEVANVMNHERTQMTENELMGGKRRNRRKKRTKTNRKKRMGTRRNKYKMRN